MPEYYEDEFVIKSRDGRRKLKFNLGITNLLDYFFELFPNGKKNEIATKADIINQVNVDTIDYDTTGGEAGGILGRLKWNNQDKTLDLGVSDGNVTLQLGQELHTPVLNKSGATILNFKVVRLVNSMPEQGGNQRVTIELAQANSVANSETTYGITTQDILNNELGFVMTYGLINNVDTQEFDEGAVLYLSSTTAGEMTQTSPITPNFGIPVAICVRKHPIIGEVLVNVRRAVSMNTLTGDTLITSPTSGQVIKYDGSKWVNGTLSESITLNNLSDVVITGVTDGDVLQYAGGNWENSEGGAMFKNVYDTNGDGKVDTAEALQTSGDPDLYTSTNLTTKLNNRALINGNNIYTNSTNTYQFP